MDYLIAGSLSALMAWIINVFLVKRWGDMAVILIIPSTEEILKTTASVVLGAPAVAAHLTFGLIEAVHDYITSKHWGLWAGLISIISHWLFGKTTVLIHEKMAVWGPGILAASLLHTLWNYAMIWLFARLAEYRKVR